MSILPGIEPTTRVVAMPADTNPAGDIFGGWIMSQVDIAGGIVASRRAGMRVATVAVNSFTFKKPVYVGDLLTCYARVVKVGNTSITVDVEVVVERHQYPRDIVQVTEAVLTYVALDANAEPASVPVEPVE